MKLISKSKPEKIVEYKGYVIRTVREAHALIAIPKEAVCYWHRKDKFETDKSAFDKMKGLIDENTKMSNLQKKKVG